MIPNPQDYRRLVPVVKYVRRIIKINERRRLRLDGVRQYIAPLRARY